MRWIFCITAAIFGLALSASAQASRNTIFGINDPRFVNTYPAATLAELGVQQVGVGVTVGDPIKPWKIPSGMGVLVVLSGPPGSEDKAAVFAAYAQRFVIAHPNVRELQVWNEPDLCSPVWPGFWNDCLPQSAFPRRFAGAALNRYLDVLAATYDALAGTGVKLIGFGFSPPWHHNDGGISFWDPEQIAAGIDSWYDSRGKHALVPRCLATTCDAESIVKSRYPRAIMDGFGYHPYAGWQPEETDRIHNALASIDMPGGTPPLWWTEFGMDTDWIHRCTCPWQGTEAEQAANETQIIEAAKDSPWVAGAFSFFLWDEVDPNRFQTGLLRPDGSKKPAFAAFATEAHTGLR